MPEQATRIPAPTHDSIRRWPADGVIRFAIAGNLNAENREAFRLALRDELLAGERRFVVDLADCPDIDGRSVGMLAGLGAVMLDQRYKAKLTFENVNEDLADYLARVHLTSVFEVRRAAAHGRQA